MRSSMKAKSVWLTKEQERWEAREKVRARIERIALWVGIGALLVAALTLSWMGLHG